MILSKNRYALFRIKLYAGVRYLSITSHIWFRNVHDERCFRAWEAMPGADLTKA